ncbi:MAG: carbamate kinase [Candidatus Sericytochromatia bacterium]|nr:carbamate kinase [Candidatus Tanganyikabacteria bacterium]
MEKLAVVAVGGNALIADNSRTSFGDQEVVARQTAASIVELIVKGWNVVVTHGNGPQVGFELIRSNAAAAETPPLPMDACGAATQGLIGTLLVRGLTLALAERGIDRPVVTVVTHVAVDEADPAFAKPTKPVGPFYKPEEALAKAEQEGWTVREDAGRGWRRVVASPQPREVVEAQAIARLVAAGVIVVACGGGGIPVVRDGGGLRGVAAVIDKDLASCVLAGELGAEVLVVATNVRQASLHYGKPEQQDLAVINLHDGKRFMAEGHFASGSMGPKVQACLEFVESGGRSAICHLEDLVGAAAGTAGTQVKAP